MEIQVDKPHANFCNKFFGDIKLAEQSLGELMNQRTVDYWPTAVPILQNIVQELEQIRQIVRDTGYVTGKVL